MSVLRAAAAPTKEQHDDKIVQSLRDNWVSPLKIPSSDRMLQRALRDDNAKAIMICTEEMHCTTDPHVWRAADGRSVAGTAAPFKLIMASCAAGQLFLRSALQSRDSTVRFTNAKRAGSAYVGACRAAAKWPLHVKETLCCCTDPVWLRGMFCMCLALGAERLCIRLHDRPALAARVYRGCVSQWLAAARMAPGVVSGSVGIDRAVLALARSRAHLGLHHLALNKASTVSNGSVGAAVACARDATAMVGTVAAPEDVVADVAELSHAAADANTILCEVANYESVRVEQLFRT
jgi:hypothetical protein